MAGLVLSTQLKEARSLQSLILSAFSVRPVTVQLAR